MRKRELLDETCDPSQSSHYDLVVTPNRQGVTIVLHDHIRQMFIGLVSMPWTVTSEADWSAAFSALTNLYPWVAGSFHSVRLGWHSPHYTLVPKPYFVPDQAKTLLQSMHPMPALDAIYANEVARDIIALFSLPSEMLNAARFLWPDFAVFHSITGLARLAMHHARKGYNLSLLLEPDATSLCLTNGSKLLAIVPQAPQTASDLLYRAVDLAVGYSLPTQEIAISIYGPGYARVTPGASPEAELLECAEVEALLAQYFPATAEVPPVGERGFSYLLMKDKGALLGQYALMECV